MTFEFATAGRIIFGAGTAKIIGEQAARLGRNAFVLTGAHAERSALVLRQLDNHHVRHTSLRVRAEPTTDSVWNGVAMARECGCDHVVAVGGGSVLDTGKVIAAMLTNGGALMDYLEGVGAGRALTHMSAPFIAVPTTAGTGAEVTRNAVLESPAHGVKVSIRSPFLLPRLAVVDPQMTTSMPPALTASTGLDALTQLLEAFVTRDANPLTDGICREGLRRAGCSLAKAFEDGGNHAAREDMCVASLCGGLALANARLGAVHGIAGPFGGMFKAPHGAVCGRLLPFVMAANIAALRQRAAGSVALARFDEAARLLTGSERAAAEDGIAWLQDRCERFALPPLSAYGFSDRHAADLIAKSLKSSSMRGNPIDLTAAELESVLNRSK
jgi:alcohol dehydrogenase class IV